MKIITAKIEHLNMIQKLSKKLILDDYNNYDKSIDVDRSHSEKGTVFFKEGIEDHKNIIYLAMDGEKAVGYIYGGIHLSSSWRTGGTHIAKLYNFFVDEDYRSHGLGSQLYAKFKKWSTNQQVEAISVVASATNEQVIKLYKKYGFKEYTLTLEYPLK
ncbi:GNAT family N-acetyltransferase [Candidatus Gracilibacteria bacterium 28_42_T64]|nr:GNAT family N-acetyltransferase [Candidatus Gracilibacteria bacterium 28_42_T64]